MKVYEFIKYDNDEVVLKLHLQEILELQRALAALDKHQEEDPKSIRVREPMRDTLLPLAEFFGKIYAAPRSGPDPM